MTIFGENAAQMVIYFSHMEIFVVKKVEKFPFFEQVNADPSATWRATHSHFLHQKQACALNETDFNEELYQADNFQYIPHNMEQSDLPVNFDGRLQWSYCQE